MTESDELVARRAAYVAAVEAERTWVLATERLQRLVDERERAAARVADMRREAQLEQDEADDWAGKGFMQLLVWLFGRLDERRELESSQALAASARLATAQTTLDALDVAIGEARNSRPERHDVMGALDDLRATWAMAAPDGYARALALETDAANAAASLKEYDEAIAAVDGCESSAGLAEDRLASARAWGTYDILGGGFISSSIKKARVQEALGAIEVTTAGIAAVRRELADIPQSIAVPNGLEMGSGAWTWDVWFDNIFSDFNMQARIGEATDTMQRLRSGLTATRHGLVEARAAAVAAADEAAARAAAEWTRTT